MLLLCVLIWLFLEAGRAHLLWSHHEICSLREPPPKKSSTKVQLCLFLHFTAENRSRSHRWHWGGVLCNIRCTSREWSTPSRYYPGKKCEWNYRSGKSRRSK